MAEEEAQKFDPKLEEGIAYFEKMLQLTPDDRVTLQFLCVAYGQIGQPDKQRRALVSLANVLLKEKDFEAADKLVEKLELYGEPDARAAVLRIRAAHRPAATQSEEAEKKDESASSASNKTTTAVYMAIKSEKKLARHLAERKVIDEAAADSRAHTRARPRQRQERRGVQTGGAGSGGHALLSLRQRAAALIAIAHPDFRDELKTELRRRYPGT